MTEQSSIESIQGPPELARTEECWRCAERYTQHGAAGRLCPECGYMGSSTVEPEGDRDEMCARHWLLDGVRDGSCVECLGADIPAERGAVVVTDDCGVAFGGDVGDVPALAPSILAPLSELARAKDVSPGDVLATFPPGNVESLELSVDIDRQQTLSEAAP